MVSIDDVLEYVIANLTKLTPADLLTIQGAIDGKGRLVISKHNGDPGLDYVESVIDSLKKRGL